MSTSNKEQSKMGLPRASGGKRRWSGEVEGSGLPSKVICTSPPHAICAEDTATSHQAHASLSREVEIAPLSMKEVLNQTQVPDMEEHGTSIMLTSEQMMDEHSSWQQEDDVEEDSNDEIEDEEDEDEDLDNEDDKDSDLSSKDSGFIDSNSMDNSSDDEENRTACLSSETSIPVTEESSEVAVPSSTSLQLSLSQALTDSTASPTSSDTSVTYTQDCSTVAGDVTTTTCTSTSSVALCSTTAALHIQGGIVGEGSLTTVTSTQTETVVTSAYQGSLTSHVYDNHSYPYSDNCLTRPGTPAWGNSCNYYEQHNTPKYMEIQPSANNNKYMEIQSTSTNKTEISQSIQCDENGKSYLELGSASPYTNTYNTNECGSYTTSPTTYPSQTYNQTYTSPSNFTQPGAYYNARQTYSPNPYVYTSGETYAAYEGETGCSYGYGGAGYSANRSQVPSTRPSQRCTTPYCDPTRGISRPSCYNQQRLSVLNMSMYKLNRFRQFAEPSLHRSVLICNTLRHIERELESEGISVASLLSHQNGHMSHTNHTVSPPPQGTQQCHEPIPSPPPVSQPSSEGPLPPMQVPMVGSPLVGAPSDPASMSPSTSTAQPTPSVTYHSDMSQSPAQYTTTGQYMPVDHPTTTYQQQQDTTGHLRPYSPMEQGEHHEQSESVPMSEPSSEVETEVPSPSPSVKSPAIPSEERTDAINWCSVLSLSSQSDLDTMNNNEYSGWGSESSNSNMDYSRGTEVSPSWKLPSLSADDVLKSFPEPNKRLENNEDLDSIINVLVGS